MEPHDEEDPNAKYWTWVDANEDKILDSYKEDDSCWEYAMNTACEDGIDVSDVDNVMKWIESHVSFKQVPDEFVEIMYERSFEVDEDSIYEQKRDK